jgi:hypothetical protein
VKAATVTVQHFATFAPIPRSFAMFTCRCGASSIEHDVRRAAPKHWTIADDGSHLCAQCAPRAKQSS